VGDTHVFYLPSHAILALLVAPGTVLAARLVARPFRRFAIDESIGTRSTAVASILVIAVAAAQAHSNFPALDRSHDQRPTQLLEGLTRGLDDRGALLLADLNWQLVNGLAYFAKVIRPEIAYAWVPRVLLYAPALIHDNLAMGRDVVLTE